MCVCESVCFADIKFARHVTWIYWMNTKAAAAAAAMCVHDEQSVSLPSPYIYFILFGLFYSLHFISFHFIWYCCLNLQSSKIHRCRARSRCTSSPLLQVTSCLFSAFFPLLRSMFRSVYFSARQSFVCFFYYYSLLLYSVASNSVFVGCAEPMLTFCWCIQ